MEDLEYKEVISELTSKFEKSVPKEEQELVTEFEKFLYSGVKSLEQSDSKFINKDKNSIIDVLKQVANKLIDYDLDTKKQQLLYDSSYGEIKKSSNNIFNMAIDKLEQKLVNIDFDILEEITKLEDLLNSVESYNKQQAEMLVSEAILDLNYINNPSESAMSLRLSHIKRALDAEEEKHIDEER